MSLNQTIVWTVLPNGVDGSGQLQLSVFVAPRLASSDTPPILQGFDFDDWTQTILAQRHRTIEFDVQFGNPPTTSVRATRSPRALALDAKAWPAIFDPAATSVDDWTFNDLSTVPLHSYYTAQVAGFCQGVYAELGVNYPTAFPPQQLLASFFGDQPAQPPPNPPVFGNVVDAAHYHKLPQKLDPHYKPPIRLLDFNNAFSALRSYPVLLRKLGLVFDLVCTLPISALGTTPVSVRPLWKPRVAGSVDVSPFTRCIVTPATFIAAPRGPDYGNGMLNLADTTRFSVVDLDTDTAALKLVALNENMQLDFAVETQPVPSLKSDGMSIEWWGFGTTAGALSDLLTHQKHRNSAIEAYVKAAKPRPASLLPEFDAEDVIRGHRIDVATPSNATGWQSLHFRKGHYRLGSKSDSTLTGVVAVDEGFVAPAGSQAAGTKAPPKPDLWVHERIARWMGWSLSSQRPGSHVASTVDPHGKPQKNTMEADKSNPIPPEGVNPDGVKPAGIQQPQISVTFAPISPATDPSATFQQLLPKLRYGATYRFRARAVDLAGNGVEVTSTDASSATPPALHVRYEPVQTPTLAGIGPEGPGQSTLLLAILNDGVHPVRENGRWCFPPKVSMLMCEEHSLLDGFVLGSPPNPLQPPDGTNATYSFLKTADSATLASIPGVKFDPKNLGPDGTPGTSTAYIPGAAKLTVPWLPDPLSAGISFNSFPDTPIWHAWEGGPWPDFLPMRILLQSGAPGSGVTHTYVAGSATDSATETVTLPPGWGFQLNISSMIPPGTPTPSSSFVAGPLGGLFTLGVWQWIAAQLSTGEIPTYEGMAQAGQMWQLSPYKTLRMVHAVRLPQLAPAFTSPTCNRELGSTKAAIFDAAFAIDTPSTGSVVVTGSWGDPVDDPSAPLPGVMTTTAHAFKLTIPDPSLVGLPGGSSFPFSLDPTSDYALNELGLTNVQDFGDTKYHDVSYTVTGTSRYSEFFRKTHRVTFTGTTPVLIKSPLGIDPDSLQLNAADGAALPAADFTFDAKKATVALTSDGVAYAATHGQPISVSWVPTDTLTGARRRLKVLATKRPEPPSITRAVPAWSLLGPAGTLETTGIGMGRRGNGVRIYLGRPWFSSGADEMVGVVTAFFQVGNPATAFPDSHQQQFVSAFGADPIVDSGFESFGPGTPSTPTSPIGFWNQPLNDGVPYGSVPVSLVEGTTAFVWPFDVLFDRTSRLWFADIGLEFPTLQTPPALFARLALVRFQANSIPGAQVSPVVLATVIQPVPDRTVLVTLDSSDATRKTATVSVTGPYYIGWRPADVVAGVVAGNQVDRTNPDDVHTYSNLGGAHAYPAITVEVQVQDTTTGLSGQLSWVRAPGTGVVRLPIAGNSIGLGNVPLPAAPGGALSMRLRICEIDFLQPGTTPSVVDTTYRRPFVVHVPLV
jgi:hypothetical protein